MNLEVSTINVLLGLIVLLQTWIIKQLIGLKVRLAIIAEHCPFCGLRKEIKFDE